MDYQVKVMVSVFEQTDYGIYRDNLYFTQEEWNSGAETMIAAIVQGRVDAWVDHQKNLPTPYQPTKNDLQSQLDETINNLTVVVQKITPLQTNEEKQAALQIVSVKGQELAEIIQNSMGI